MNRCVMATALISTLAATVTTETKAATSDADMARCAAIAARDARLDCYDALAQQSSSKAAAPGAGQVTAPSASQVAALPAAAAPAVAAVPAVSPAAAPPATVVVGDPKNFGLTAVQQHIAEAGPKSITANITNLVSDQSGATLILLDNDQTWSVADNDGWIAAGQAVRIKRAAMGSYLMLIPSNHSYHVRRVH